MCLPRIDHALTIYISVDTFAHPVEFLKAIGRSSETKVTIEKWEDFWRISGHQLKKSGLAVRDRRYACVLSSPDLPYEAVNRTRYILWCMEKYRSGIPVESFSHEPRPKKTIRG